MKFLSKYYSALCQSLRSSRPDFALFAVKSFYRKESKGVHAEFAKVIYRIMFCFIYHKFSF